MMDDINLVPKDIQFVIDWSYNRIMATVAVPLFVSIVGVWFFQLSAVARLEDTVKREAKVLVELRGKRSEIATMIDGVKEISGNKAALSDMVGIMRNYYKERIVWSSIIEDLSLVEMRRLWLTGFEVKEEVKWDYNKGKRLVKQLSIRGVSLDNDSIAKLLSFVENHPLFNNVVLYQNERGEVGEREAYFFTVACEVVR
jgi:hypothetical protein